MKNLKTVLLKNNQGMSVEIINFGARIKSILFPVQGNATEMIVGYLHPEDYLTDEFYLGATCGRVCNRIEAGKFDLNGVSYALNQNENEHCLHGGVDNFSYRFWQVESSTNDCVILTLESEDGDQGFPATLKLQVIYHLTDSNQLKINYLAIADAPTPINITNHAYFNLGNKSCESLYLQIIASTMLERKDNGLPSGKILAVEGTDFDFRQLINIGERQTQTSDVNLKKMACFDHCYVLDEVEISEPKAILMSKSNGIKMSLYTDQSAIQLYTGGGLRGDFYAYQGACLEAQNYSNAININHFPNSVLLPEEEYKREIIYQFDSV